jgi:HNH endonuclease
MSEYISVKNREFVGLRANYCCEYCRSPQRFSLFTFHIDHIISLKHGGTSKIINLAFACGFCNGNKGTDLGTFLHFFNPRKDNWTEHFEMIEGVIYGKTDIGEVTVKLFKMNEIERILERKLLIEGGFISI